MRSSRQRHAVGPEGSGRKPVRARDTVAPEIHEASVYASMPRTGSSDPASAHCCFSPRPEAAREHAA